MDIPRGELPLVLLRLRMQSSGRMKSISDCDLGS